MSSTQKVFTHKTNKRIYAKTTHKTSFANSRLHPFCQFHIDYAKVRTNIDICKKTT